MQLLKSVRALKPRAIKAQLNSAIQDEQMHKLTVCLLVKIKKKYFIRQLELLHLALMLIDFAKKD